MLPEKKSANDVLNKVFCGKLKYVKSGSQPSWKAGTVCLSMRNDGQYVLTTKIGVEDRTRPHVISAERVQKVTAKSRVVIDFKSGETFHFATDNSPLASLLGKFLCKIVESSETKQGKNVPLFSTRHLASPIQTGRFNTSPVQLNRSAAICSDVDNCHQMESSGSLTTFCNPTLSPISTNMVQVSSQSTPKFTGMKERVRRVELFTNIGDPVKSFDESSEDETKENVPVKRENNPYAKNPNHLLLNKSREKSQSTLAATSFYNTGQGQHNYSGLSFSSGINDKRKPALLPSFPYKRPKLVNIDYSWRPTKPNFKEQTSLQGFSNLGNTCYMNAILQSLYSLDTFRSDLTQSRRSLQKLLSKEDLLAALSALFIAQSKGVTQDKKRMALRMVKNAISSSAKRFSGYEQHDAHEFLSQVLDQLKEDTKRLSASTPSPPSSDADIEVLEQLNRKSMENPISTNFESAVRHSISCLQCGSVVVKEETFHDLAIDLPRRSKIHLRRSLQDALNQFFSSETLDYKCEECEGMQSKVSHHFIRLPRVLILHLKRYNFMSLAQKVACPVFIPKFMTLQLCCNEETQPPAPPVILKENVTVSPMKDRVSGDETRRKLVYSGLGKRPYKFMKPGSRQQDEDSSSDVSQVKRAVEQSLQTSQQEDPDYWKVIEMSKQETTAMNVTSDEEEQLAKAIQMSIQESENHKNSMEEDEQLKKALELSLLESSPVEQEVQFAEDLPESVFPNHEGDDAMLQRLAENAELLQKISDNTETGDLPYSYQLVSVVSHIGSMSSAGHYVSDVYDLKKRSWLKCDDSHVEMTDEKTVRESREKTGYIFFYLAKDVFDDLVV